MDKFLLLTFESSNFAMQCEKVLKESNMRAQVIPTPREITLSCGLSILTDLNNIDNIKSLLGNKSIRVKKLYNMEGSGRNRAIKEIEV